MNDIERINARAAIIEAAGELFAEHGLEGVTVRDIVKKAGANLGSLSYHFTNKEELYREVLLAAMGTAKAGDWSHIVDAAPTRDESPEGLAAAIDRCIRRLLSDMLLNRNKPWCAKLLLRELAQPTNIWNEFMDKIVIPDLQRLVALYRKAMPGSSAVDAQIWAFTLHAHAMFYQSSDKSLRRVLEVDPLSDVFMGKVIDHVSSLMLRSINLPIPAPEPKERS